jgi:hypothetical protein
LSLASGKFASSFAPLPSPARASLRFHSGPRIRHCFTDRAMLGSNCTH